ncbi:P60-like protein [Trichodelitschia bisporula]|uniref:Ribosome biogenesis protein NOP53 n=1 Tax=Trichodelitschia bisporula TaxID=703511 RepID=A0A6G1HLK2_9PEZI|nr:P60-like protein [Trichodelitschia bisporula]
MATLPPQQHAQPSRKGKKAWRKNVDLTQVESGLSTVRDEVITGGVVAEKASEDLFTIDVAPSVPTARAYAKSHKPLKADEILAERSAVPPLDGRKRPATVTDGVLPDKKRRAVSAREMDRLRKIAYGGEAKKAEVLKTDVSATYDPWDAQPVQSAYTFLDPPRKAREPETIRRAPLAMTKSGRPVAAVQTPNPGKSYNPAFADWAALVEKEGTKAVDEEVKRLEEERLEAERIARIEAAQAEEEDKKMESEWESEWETEWDGLSDADVDLKVKRPQRKTQAERNRIRRRKEEERRRTHEEKAKKREQQVAQARALVKQLDKREKAKVKAPVVESESEEEGETLRRRRLGKAPIPEGPLEVVLADELQDSLRLLKPEGNLLTDRFRSLLLRGKIESRAPITQRKKPRRTTTEKWSYKDWKLK